tara:strand:- start:425 stop:670 length:246 start_codon:yes stop_codon:yes gene_type:complete
METHPKLIRLKDGKAKLIGPCYISGEEYSTKEFNEGKYMSWILKEDLIQNLLPELDADDREFLITGISPKSWDEMNNDKDN